MGLEFQVAVRPAVVPLQDIVPVVTVIELAGEKDQAMTNAAATLPHWDMSVVYPGLESSQFEQSFTDIIAGIDALTALFDARGIQHHPSTPLNDATVASFEEVIEQFNRLLELDQTLVAYVFSFVATNSRDDRAQARLSELQQQQVRLQQLGTRLTAWIGSLDVEALIARSTIARDYSFLLHRAQVEARHLMSPAEEELAATLNLTGGTAWGNLHSNLSSQLMVAVEGADGMTELLPMSVVRNRASDADREVRRRAYEAEIACWRENAVPFAAALNSIKGEVNLTSARRGWPSPLDASLFANRIDRETLEAMLQAARASFPDFRRYLRAKARTLGVQTLAWYDLFAPVSANSRTWSYDEAEDFIVTHFAGFSPQLQDLARRAFAEHWIDAEPRAGKQGGGFCMPLHADESRILVNYTPAFDGVSTLAHELGHAFHNRNLAGNPALQRDTPAALAETASIFCETIMLHAGLAGATAQEQIAVLEGTLQSQCGIVVDITSRFLFEQSVFEARLKHELSTEDLNELMLNTQRATYGDGLDGTLLHPYMWAVKGHYYSTDLSYYNYPYMFGLLFGLGLYAAYQAEPQGFTERYDALLAWTGRADAAELARRFGIEIRRPDFWHSSLDVIRQEIDRFERLVDEWHGL